MRGQETSFAGDKGFIRSWGLGLLLVLIMANLSALIDLVVHPEISYFDAEHLLVGGITALTTAVIYLLLMSYVANLKNKEHQIRQLNEELEQKIEERTRELLNAQEELVRKEKLFIIGELSGSVGHELRNPLGVMSNAVFFLKMLHADADSTTKEYLEIIKQEIDNSLRIITDLLDFARTKPPQRSAIIPMELVRKSLPRCAIPENITVRIDVPAALPSLYVDPLQMGQVLTNFISNAVQAMPDGGTLRVAARQISRCEFVGSQPETSDQKQKTDSVAISFTDSGEGISPENMKKIFQPLFTTKARGLGLGLVVCKNLVEANGGRIEVESELAKGATFTVLLPSKRGNP